MTFQFLQLHLTVNRTQLLRSGDQLTAIAALGRYWQELGPGGPELTDSQPIEEAFEMFGQDEWAASVGFSARLSPVLLPGRMIIGHQDGTRLLQVQTTRFTVPGREAENVDATLFSRPEASQHKWAELIDSKLLEWGRHPESLEDDGTGKWVVFDGMKLVASVPVDV